MEFIITDKLVVEGHEFCIKWIGKYSNTPIATNIETIGFAFTYLHNMAKISR